MSTRCSCEESLPMASTSVEKQTIEPDEIKQLSSSDDDEVYVTGGMSELLQPAYLSKRAKKRVKFHQVKTYYISKEGRGRKISRSKRPKRN